MIKEYDLSMQEEVLSIWLSITVKAHSFIPESYWAKNFIYIKSHYLPNSDTFVYERNGEIIGFVSVIAGNLIGALFIKEEYQGKGIGKALLNQCKQYYDQLNLKVYVKNETACAFYESQGFMVDEEQTDDETGEKEYKMSWVSDDWVDMMLNVQC